MNLKALNRTNTNNLMFVGVFVFLASLLSSCGTAQSENSIANEFASINYSKHAAKCGMDQLYNVNKYTSMQRIKNFDSTADFKLIDKYPDIFKYDDSFDSWRDYMSSESAPYEQERANTLKCKAWLDKLDLTTPKETEYPGAWSVISEQISKIGSIVETRVQLFDDMYALLPYKSTDKTQRDKFYGIVNEYEKGRNLAYESHIAIRQILELNQSNGVDYWLATCPTYISVNDLYGNNVITSEDGTLKISNNTKSEKQFEGTVHFKNKDGVEVASQSISVTLPAGKSFDQSLEAVEGNDDYTGLLYPAKCTFTES